MAAASTAAERVDGRTLRRERGRQAVADAVIDLIFEGQAPPAVEQVAARAGVSPSSVFRYFATVDDLRRAGIQRWLDRYQGLLAIPELGQGGLAERIERLVEARLGYHQQAEPMARLVRRQADTVPDLEASLTRVRATLLAQLAEHFRPELGALAPTAREERTALIAALTSFETWDQLGQAGLDRPRIARAMGDGLRLLLMPRE